MGHQLRLKRVYEPVEPEDGTRFLVERLWPRGIKKSELVMAAWLKDVAPSTELRHWFNHDPAKWAEFKVKYFKELDGKPGSYQPITKAFTEGNVTLLYSAHDQEHNNAGALKEYLER